ncbi:EAL domain-containing protein [Vibrio alginolyticus]|uniref:EAL domain-containing protein n=1 Tax=Vibrio alginolyticus TaxID=663 RepID=UPI001BD5D07E|nr:EAL domain-containing protein [Vibrio alginolyticus]MBS9855597.1 EAL domain-containing protein [Vibrio alginolyticus]
MDLKSSISNSIFLHPIYSSETGDVAFSEVLYTIPDGCYDEQFLDMNVSDEIIMESALDIVKKFQNNNKYKFSVNITANILLSDEFITRISSFNNKNLVIEVNEIESNMLSNLYLSIKKLKESGIEFCLDSFCHKDETFNQCLGYIDWDYIKIDKKYSFRDLEKHVAQILIPFCNVGVIIDGVDSSIKQYLKRSKKIYYQGYYKNPPKRFAP